MYYYVINRGRRFRVPTIAKPPSFVAGLQRGACVKPKLMCRLWRKTSWQVRVQASCWRISVERCWSGRSLRNIQRAGHCSTSRGVTASPCGDPSVHFDLWYRILIVASFGVCRGPG
jgi:hypothetical protein